MNKQTEPETRLGRKTSFSGSFCLLSVKDSKSNLIHEPENVSPVSNQVVSRTASCLQLALVPAMTRFKRLTCRALRCCTSTCTCSLSPWAARLLHASTAPNSCVSPTGKQRLRGPELTGSSQLRCQELRRRRVCCYTSGQPLRGGEHTWKVEKDRLHLTCYCSITGMRKWTVRGGVTWRVHVVFRGRFNSFSWEYLEKLFKSCMQQLDHIRPSCDLFYLFFCFVNCFKARIHQPYFIQ